MLVQVHDDAADELGEAEDWYRAHSDSAADRLVNSVARAIRDIAANPRIGRRIGRKRAGIEIRQLARVGAFPYSIAYVVYEESLRIMAFAHSSRRPLYWLGRLETRRKG